MRLFAQPAGTQPDIEDDNRLVYVLEAGEYAVTEIVAPMGCELVDPFGAEIVAGGTTSTTAEHQCKTGGQTDDGGDDGADDGHKHDEPADKGAKPSGDGGKVTDLPSTGQGPEAGSNSSVAALLIAALVAAAMASWVTWRGRRVM